jgi:hypothetical protein
MDDRKRSLEETLDYAIAIGRFDSAFEACERLNRDDRQSLLKQAANRITMRLMSEPSDTQAALTDTSIGPPSDEY